MDEIHPRERKRNKIMGAMKTETNNFLQRVILKNIPLFT
jgi:hypothetical protein